MVKTLPGRVRVKPSTAIVPIAPSSPTELAEAIQEFTVASVAPNTRRARAADWKVFTSWCAVQEAETLPAPPKTVAEFLVSQVRAKKASATIIRYSQSIAAVHRAAGHASPIGNEGVQLVLRGIRRTLGIRPQKQKAAFSAEVAETAVPGYVPSNKYQGARDLALVLFGLATAMRESEICALDIEDLKPVGEGFLVDIKRSKTDQEGRGRLVAVKRLREEFAAFCQVRALETWIALLGAKEGPIFRGLRKNGRPRPTRLLPGSVDAIVKRVVSSGGSYDAKKFAGHSLRAGYVTTARMEGIDWGTIMEQTGHKTMEGVKRYARYAPDTFAATRVEEVFRNAFRGRKG